MSRLDEPTSALVTVACGRPGAARTPRISRGCPMDKRTVGAAFTTPSGTDVPAVDVRHLHLPSYGPVRTTGPRSIPATYNYRRAALDALHFPKLVDRVWQNLRRAAGYQVQYFAVVEAQRRLAPHLHAAIRGAIPRETAAAGRARDVPPGVVAGAPRCRRTETELPVWTDEHGYVDPRLGRTAADLGRGTGRAGR